MNSHRIQNASTSKELKRKRTRSQFFKRVQFEDFSSGKTTSRQEDLKEKQRLENQTNSSTPFLEDASDVEKSSFVANFDVILAKEAFYDLRQEARSYLRTTQKLVKSSQSFFEETRRVYSSSVVESLKVPSQDHPQDFQVSNASRDFSSLQEELARLQENFEKLQKIRLEKDSVDLRCTGCFLF
jgi:hypothetical protein